MKKLRVITAIIFSGVFFATAIAQNTDKEDLAMAAQENMKPGKMHQLLYKMVGTWNGKVKLRLQAGVPPLEFTTESVYETIDNGLHLRGKTAGNIMGMPFTGHEHFGYNNPTRKFFVTWIDNLGSGIQFLEGNYDEAAKTFTYTGNTTDPLGQPVKITRTLKFLSDTETHYEFFTEQNGQKSKAMEIDFSKVEAPKTNAQNYKLSDLAFLQGKWKVENKETYELWKLNADNTLSGNSFKIKDGKEVISEHLSLAMNGDKIIYSAKVLNQNNGEPVNFTLNKEVTNKFSFENPTHDFPKKIQYTKLDEKTLFVEVLGEGDRGFSFKMMKQ